MFTGARRLARDDHRRPREDREVGAQRRAHGSPSATTCPSVGAWSFRARSSWCKRRNRWRVKWTPETIDPQALDRWRHDRRQPRLADPRADPRRRWASAHHAGDDRWSSASSASGSSKPARYAATCSPPALRARRCVEALAAAKQHPTYFEPIFTISQTRFDQLKAQPGPTNVYNVPRHAVRGDKPDGRDHASS